ncbi:hypothetical protein [Streptomyces violascens]|uniref:hypothetical protein n=1 Tax=Streptomyces violascens TaxID=67381 RepID=UPI0036A1F06E
MTDADTPAEAPALAALPSVLSPRDESRVAFARATWALGEGARDLMPVDPETPAGDLVRAALVVQEQATEVVQRAVIAERERGTTWEQIAQAAGITRQTAHERWSDRTRAWADLGRSARRREEQSTTKLVQFLDAEYALSHPDRPHSVSAGLDAVRHPGSAADQDARRARSRALRTRRDDLERDHARLQAEWERLREPADRRGRLRLAANLSALADLQAAFAELFQELAAAEPELAEEHLGSATDWRNRAEDYRSYADTALDAAGTA